MRRLFALDQNFPQPIVDALTEYIIEAELVPIAPNTVIDSCVQAALSSALGKT